MKEEEDSELVMLSLDDNEKLLILTVRQEFDRLVDSDWFITRVNELVDRRLQDVVRAFELGIETVTRENIDD